MAAETVTYPCEKGADHGSFHMTGRTVLAVAPDGVDTDAVASSTPTTEDDLTIRTLDRLGDLYDELCRSVVHCLLLSTNVEERTPFGVARGVACLFPDLPIVVAGSPLPPVPDDLAVTTVDAETLADERVGRTVAELAPEGDESAAARPPSRMETLWLSMFDQFPVHLFAKDREARHVVVSRHANEPTDLVGITDLEYEELPRSHREAAYRDDVSVIENDEARLKVEEYTNYVDSHVLSSKVPWYDADGDVIGLAGLTEDISERKARERASRRQHELLVKLALVSAHELRNELQVADGRLRLAEADSSQLEVVAESHDRLSDIVDTVVALASQERTEHDPRPVWLSTLSREVWDTLDVGRATFTVADDARLVADPESASLLLQILFTNAIEHNDDGDHLRVTVGTTSAGFFVADDGRGIDAEPPERVFDAGYTTGDDTGFGLYVARSTAEDHGWDLTVSESDEGGARFDLRGVTLVE